MRLLCAKQQREWFRPAKQGRTGLFSHLAPEFEQKTQFLGLLL